MIYLKSAREIALMKKAGEAVDAAADKAKKALGI